MTAIAALKEIGANLLLYFNHCVATNMKVIVIKSIAKDDVKKAVEDLRESVDTILEKIKEEVEGKEEFPHLTRIVKDLKKIFAQVAGKGKSTRSKWNSTTRRSSGARGKRNLWREKWTNLPKSRKFLTLMSTAE